MTNFVFQDKPFFLHGSFVGASSDHKTHFFIFVGLPIAIEIIQDGRQTTHIQLKFDSATQCTQTQSESWE